MKEKKGRVQDRVLAQQQRRVRGLNLVVAAIILWNTLELACAVEELLQEGVVINPEQLAHLSPMDWEYINLTGDMVAVCLPSNDPLAFPGDVAK